MAISRRNRFHYRWVMVALSTVLLFSNIFISAYNESNKAFALDPNIAIGKTASSDTGTATLSSGNDDSIYTQWRADDGNANHWYKIDLGASYDLSGTEVVFEAGYLIKYKVEASSDNTAWTTVVDKTNNTSSSQTQTDSFSSSGKRYVRITLTELPSGVWAAINEFRIFGTSGGSSPPSPSAFTQTSPASNASGVQAIPSFTWGASANATSYSIVVATNAAYTSPIINQSGLTTTSFMPGTALANNTTYYWKVTATNATGSTVATNAGISFTTAAVGTVPGAFSQTAPASGATNASVTPAFTWGAASGATSYDIVVSTSATFASPVINQTGLTGTSFTPGTALANNTTYYWKVTATNATGSTVATNAGISFTTAAVGTVPGAFSQTAPASGATNASVTPAFTWGAASGATSYALVVSTSAIYTSPVINQTGLTGTSFTPGTALANNTTYYWKVTATNATGSTVATNAGISFTTAAVGTVPGAFSQTAPASSATNASVTPAFTWGAASGATSYAIVVSTSATYTSPVINQTGLTGTSFTPGTALANNTTYYWKVTATNATGSTVATNAGISFTTAAAGPVTLLSQGKPASSDSTQSGFSPSDANDGNDFNMWRAADDATGHWWKVDLQNNYRITSVDIKFESNYNMKYKIEVSKNNTNWVTAVDKSNNASTAQNQTLTFTAVDYRYLRVTIVGQPGGVWSSIWEIKVYGNNDLSPSSDASVYSDFYSVDSTANTISNVPYNTSVSSFASSFYPAIGASYALYASDGVTVKSSGAIVTGDKVSVWAQNNTTTKTYTVNVLPPSNNATLSSNAYAVDNNANTISGVAYLTPAGTFAIKLTPAPYAVYAVYRSDGITVKPAGEAMLSGDKVISTAQDGITKKTYTVSVLPPSNASSLFSDLFVISGTSVTVPSVTSLLSFRSGIYPSAFASFVVYNLNGTVKSTGNMVTGDYVVVTAQNGTTTTTFTVTTSSSVPVYQFAQNDSFDNALGNIELSQGWERGLIGKEADGNRYLAQNLQAQGGDWQYLTDTLDSPIFGNARIKFKFKVDSVENTKIAARTWAVSEQILDLVLQPNGSSAYLAAKYGTDYSQNGTIPGGAEIFPHVWYDVTIDIDNATKKFSVWVGTKPASVPSYDFMNANANFVRAIEFIGASNDSSAWNIDNFQVMKRVTPISPVVRPALPIMADDRLSHVDVFYKNLSGRDFNSQVADTGEYIAEYDMSSVGFSSLKTKGSGYPNDNLLAQIAVNSFSPVIKVNGKWYRTSNVKNRDHVIIKKAGNNMWEIFNRGLVVADDSGAILNALAIDQHIYFWNEKFYVQTIWRPLEDIAGVEYAGIETYVNPGAFNKYNVGSGDVNIPASGTLAGSSGPILDQATFFDSNATSHGSLTYQVINKAGTESVYVKKGNFPTASDSSIAVTQYAYDKDKHGGASTTLKAAHSLFLYNQVFVSPLNGSAAGLTDTNLELNPLSGNSFKVTGDYPYAGSKVLGYDNKTGAYMIEQFVPDNNYFLTNKNMSPSVKFEFTNGTQPRKIRLGVTMAKNALYLPGATGAVPILTDENMIPNGIHSDTTKKWDIWEGWHWENYADSYSVFDLAANENKKMWHRWAMQEWGNKITVGTNVLDLTHYLYKGWFWLEQFEGISEAYAALPDDGEGTFTIGDVRAVDGPTLNDGGWKGAASGVEFLKFYDSNRGAYVSPKKRSTGFRFNGMGPNLASYSMRMETADDVPGVRQSVETYLLPGTTGTRAFHKIRVDFLQDMTFTDIKKQLRFFSILDDGHPNNATKATSMVYTNTSGQEVTVPVTHPYGSIAWDVVGAPLKKDGGWATFPNGQDWVDGTKPMNDIGMIVHYVNGSLNNVAQDSVAVSMYSYRPWNQPEPWRDTAVLVPNTVSNTVKAGDYMEMLVEVYDHGDSGNLNRIRNEADKWPYSVTVSQGTLQGNGGYPPFPAVINAGTSQVAQFTITGGTDLMPFTVAGFNSYAEPKLEELIGGTWTAVNQTAGIKDGGQTELDMATGKYKFTYAVPTTGATRTFRVSLATPAVPTIPSALPKILNKLDYITDFKLDEAVTYAEINVETRVVNIQVRPGTNLTALTPTLTLVDGAQVVSPVSGPVNFTNPVTYTIRSEDGSLHDWLVKVTIAQ